MAPPRKRRALDGLDSDRDKRPRTASDSTELVADNQSELSTSKHPKSVRQAKATRAKPRSEEKLHACPECGKCFNRPARLEAHIRAHNDDRPHKCDFDGCHSAFSDLKHLRQHIKETHYKERPFLCEVPGCDASFPTKSKLQRHIDAHVAQSAHQCTDYPPCDKKFRKAETLQSHILKDHLGQSPWPCAIEECGLGYETKAALEKHQKIHHGPARFWCSFCQSGLDSDDAGRPADALSSVGFTTEARLNAHIRAEHSTCEICQLDFPKPSNLLKHMDMYHNGIPIEERKTVECTWPGCEKRFTRRTNMSVHLRSAHHGLSYICDEASVRQIPGLEDWSGEMACGNGFTSKAKLGEHVRFVHLGEKRPAPTVRLSNHEGQSSATDEPKGSRDTNYDQSSYIETVEAIRNPRSPLACVYPFCDQQIPWDGNTVARNMMFRTHMLAHEEEHYVRHLSSSDDLSPEFCTKLLQPAARDGSAFCPHAGCNMQFVLDGSVVSLSRRLLPHLLEHDDAMSKRAEAEKLLFEAEQEWNQRFKDLDSLITQLDEMDLLAQAQPSLAEDFFQAWSPSGPESSSGHAEVPSPWSLGTSQPQTPSSEPLETRFDLLQQQPSKQESSTVFVAGVPLQMPLPPGTF